jgi:hypothetical protein
MARVEVLHLYVTLLNQGPQAVVNAAKAQTQLFRKLPLIDLWVVAQDFQHPEVRVLLQSCLTTDARVNRDQTGKIGVIIFCHNLKSNFCLLQATALQVHVVQLKEMGQVKVLRLK